MDSRYPSNQMKSAEAEDHYYLKFDDRKRKREMQVDKDFAYCVEMVEKEKQHDFLGQ